VLEIFRAYCKDIEQSAARQQGNGHMARLVTTDVINQVTQNSVLASLADAQHRIRPTKLARSTGTDVRRRKLWLTLTKTLTLAGCGQR
jgi:hypothetical protein